WNRLHADRATFELSRQIVLALRIWQPDVIVTGCPGENVSGFVAEAIEFAFKKAHDPEMHPEQITALYLKPSKPCKLYERWPLEKGENLRYNGYQANARLAG